MKTMNCQTCRDEVEEARLRQRLSGAARAHLSACAPCRIFEDERHALKGLVAELEQVSAPPDFDWKLRARLNSTKSTAPRRGLLGLIFTPSTPALALAASFALLVAGAVAFKQVGSRWAANSRPAEVSGVRALETKETKNNSTVVSQPGALQVATGGDQDISGELQNPRGRRTEPFRSNGLNVEKASSRATRATDFSANGANVVRRDVNFDSESNPLIAVEVRPSAQPAKLLVGDERGTTRTVSLEPVSFGAQDMIERPDAARLSSPAVRGIW